VTLPSRAGWLPSLALACALLASAGHAGDLPADAPAAVEPAVPGFDFGALPPEVAEAARASRHLPLAERLDAVSAPMLGRPYLDGCTGEGQGVDPDPPARYDVYDCLTFVEEVLALGLAPDPAWAPMYRSALRFQDAEPSYERRNHFFVMDWIANNVEAGLIRDITEQLGPVEWIDKPLDAGTWANWRHRGRFALDDDQLPVGRLRLPVLSLETALEVVDRIPPGSLVVTVRVPLDHVPITVTHVGLVVPGEQPTMRHATRMGDKLVRDDSLAWYLRHLQSYSNWPVAGVNLLMPLEQGPRLGALDPAHPRPASAGPGR